ncbi:MAG: phosphonate ABC transporter, permease protein PhnE [Rhodospirillaceae bacterium]|nr:phosphonate ABC transporter, permease protein PhnE [Rhodospirillaceae bacterium]
MAVIEAGGAKTWRKLQPRDSLWRFAAWLAALAVTVACWQKIAVGTEWSFVLDAPAQAGDIWDRMVPPEWGYASVLGRPVWDTLNMATLGTMLGVVIAVPLAFLAASNTTPSAAFARPFALFCIVASRSINSVIWALVLVMILGPGVLAGTIAIGLRSVGFIGKLLYESIEEIDRRPVEAVVASGASHAQVVSYAVVPQVMPIFAGIAVFRWDINIRESTILGLVGAGGLGLQLNSAIGNLDWSRVSVILLAIFATVIASEWVSARVRKAMT